MENGSSSTGKLSRFTAFATLGALGTTQELAHVFLRDVKQADREVVAEETLSLVAITTARAADVGLRNEPETAGSVVDALVDLPFLYRDYLIGGAMMLQQDQSLLDSSEDVYQRLQRKQDFYSAHFAPSKFPAEAVLRDKMGLWMGRVSPPGLPDSPMERLERLDSVRLLLTHLKLVLAFGRRGFSD